MTIMKSNLIHDAGSVDADGDAVAGCQNTTPAGGATGVYTLTMDEPLDATEGVCLITPRTAADVRVFTTVWTSDTVITATCHDEANAAADCAFDFLILNLAK